MKEINLNSTIGPFIVPPFQPPIGCSAISTRNKKSSGDKRIIMDFSFPLFNSINDQIPSNSYLGCPAKLEYPTVDTVAQEVARIGSNARIWKKDLSRYYKQMYLCLTDVPLQGFRWKGKWYFDLTLIMGCQSAPYIAMRCSTALKYIHNQMGYFSVVYCDDFFLVLKMVKN